MDGDSFTLELAPSIADIPAAEWDAIAGMSNPFVSHAFLRALEVGGATGGDSGWDPMHLVLRDAEGRLAAAMPHYLKHHSYGEYIFDHSWANAFTRAGGSYYPKMLSAVPFTPATGPRFLVGDAAPDRAAQLRAALADGMVQYLERLDLSSAHVNFLPESDTAPLAGLGWMIRSSIQFHWQNDGYADFDAFLGALASRKRKAIRKERAAAVEGLEIVHLTGDDIRPEHWDAFWIFYQDTGSRKWGRPYLTRGFFPLLGEALGDRVLLILALRDGVPIAGALNLIGADTLYGRYWGCTVEVPFLHFELCYYQAIDAAIARGLRTVEAGAQGEHKLARGYVPVPTWSAHYIPDPNFRRAVADYLVREREGVEAEQGYLAELTPFRRGNGS